MIIIVTKCKRNVNFVNATIHCFHKLDSIADLFHSHTSLFVGMGNSAADIATDASYVAKQVSLDWSNA